VRAHSPQTQIEVLMPDFRGRRGLEGREHAAVGAPVRSSYRAEKQAEDMLTQPSTKGRASGAATSR